MVRGIYSAAAGMTTQYKKIDMLGNNISNVNTTGYKQKNVTITTFGDELATRTNDQKEVGNIPLCAYLDKESTDYSNGTLNYTGLNSDLAITTNGFFAVNDNGTVKYTRAGEFTVDGQGFLTTPDGARVLSTNMTPLQVGVDNFQVNSDGTILTPNANVGTIGVFANQDPATIVSRRDGFYDIPGATAVTGGIRQGWLENSNTDVINNMTSLMDSQRAFQGSQQAMSVTLSTVDKLVNEVGSMR